MKTKEILTIVIAILLFTCTKPDPNLVIIRGNVTNPNGTYVLFESNDTTYATTLNEIGTFEITFSLDSAKYIRFKHGTEETSMYVKPGDKIYLTIDPNQFDESIHYEGSETSSFLARLFLWRENTDFYGKEYYLGSPDEFKMKLEDLKAKLFSEFKTINDSSFIKAQKAYLNRFLSRYIREQKQFSKNEKDVRVFTMEKAEIDKKYDFEAAIDSLNFEKYSAMLNEYSDTINSLISKLTDKEMIKNSKEILQYNINWYTQKKKIVLIKYPKRVNLQQILLMLIKMGFNFHYPLLKAGLFM